MKKKIAIIGSGIAGLTLSNLLQTNSNFTFVVYEKNENLNLEEGFGVQLSVNSISILNKIGFDNIDKNEKFHPSKLDFYNINYNKICELDLTIFNSEKYKYTTIKRSILIKFLKEKLLSNSIIFRKKINHTKQDGEKINIYFTDGSSDVVDYLIVSDGVFSNSKLVIEKNFLKPNYFGAVAIRSKINISDLHSLNPKNISLLMGSESHIVIYPINQKKEFNLVCAVKSKLVEKDDIDLILKNKIFKQNKNLTNLFNENLKSWPIYTTTKPTKSIYKNIFYIGDAFYTFPPTLAQGASQAIESANEIFTLIKENSLNIQKTYFEKRKKKIDLINKRSKFNYFGFHISNPILIIIRNKILKFLVKNKNFVNNYLGKIYK